MNGQINRATQLWRNWEEKEKMLLEVFGNSLLSENLNKQRYEFLSAGVARISKDTTSDEKLVLGLIKKSTRRLEKELYPHPLVRLARRVKVLVYDRPVAASRLKKAKADNLVALDQTLSKLGFHAEKLGLDKLLDFERPEINIRLSAPYGVDANFGVQLHLEKDVLGRYQVQGYTGMLKDPLDASASRSFRFDADLGINAREAVNLLQGRAVMKHYQIGPNRMGSKWVQLDFTRLTPDGKPILREMGADYEFNLRQEIGKIAQVLNKPELESARVLDGMQQGNQVVLKQVSGETSFLQASPLDKQVVLLDEQRRPITLEKLKKQKEAALKLEPGQEQTRVRKMQLSKKQQQDQSLGIA